MSLKANQDAKNIGARFRSARALVPDLNRKSFCERHGINRYTMQSWENGLHVSKGKNVEKFIEALAREGVYCSSEWLIDGKGESARALLPNSRQPVSEITPPKISYENEIIEGLGQIFSLKDKILVTYVVSDQSMAPKFDEGDIVFGDFEQLDKNEFHQKYCMIKLAPDRIIVRKVFVTKEGFLITALNEKFPTFFLNFDTELALIKGVFFDYGALY